MKLLNLFLLSRIYNLLHPPIAFMFQVVLLQMATHMILLKYQRVATSITWSYNRMMVQLKKQMFYLGLRFVVRLAIAYTILVSFLKNVSNLQCSTSLEKPNLAL